MASDYEIARRHVESFLSRPAFDRIPQRAAPLEDMVMAAIREARVQPIGLDPVQPEGKPARSVEASEAVLGWNGHQDVAELMATQEGMGQS